MVNDIINGISIAINAEFNDEEPETPIPIFDESVKQGLDEPCFFIRALSPKEIQIIGRRYKSDNTFEIRYFPSSEAVNYECNSVAGRLFSALNQITLVDQSVLNGSNMSYEIIDDVLIFLVNFNLILIAEGAEADKMETLSTITGIKE